MNISEFELIEQIKNSLVTTPVDMIRGIGEDCAVVKKDDEHVSLITTDCLVENVHFDLSCFSFIDVGKKALSVNLSDIAAMAGLPRYAFVSLGIPKTMSEEQIRDFYFGLEQIAQEFSTAIIGGDISRTPDLFFVNITVMGVAKNHQYKLRSTAKPGDGIYVSGNVGSAALGLRFLQKKKKVENQYIQALKNPKPRLYLSNILSEFQSVHSMIDLSDGLLQDLGHILKSSNVCAKIDFDKLPLEKDFVHTCKKLKMDPKQTALTGGEDYQLLFTMDESDLEELNSRLNKNKIQITKIGEVLDSKNTNSTIQERLHVFENDSEMKLENVWGWDHFRK